MLVQFMLKNVLSFKEEAILDMAAIPAYKEHEYNLIKHREENFLKVAAIYGANASGKSNLHQAWSFFQSIIVESFNNTADNVGDNRLSAIEKYYVPFSFEETPENSEFQITFIDDDIFEYRYGFEYNASQIVSEWLYRRNATTKRTITIFERTYDTIKFGVSVRRECDKYKEQVPKDALALSFFNKLSLKTDLFNIVYLNAALNTLVIDSDNCENVEILKGFLPKILTGKKSKEKLLAFLSSIDTGIRDLDFDDSEKEIRFYTKHLGRNGSLYPLNLFAESEGTIKSIMIYIFVQMAIMNNKSLFVDELNTKLHPLLLKFIIDLFYDPDSTAQLIYTTHDTTLMDKKFFRRDQIWFVQKDEFGYSDLSALSDFKVRSDASFEKDYLAGVYGGIPLLKEFSMKEGD